jgi:histidinol phosphatase-like enzyme (inositol monophosphatase family)
MMDFLPFAEALADAARRETLPRWTDGCPASDKGGPEGFDPVTDADREAEAAMRRLIEHRFPNHGISGEEMPERPARGRWSWSLDPVDGTRSFVCGLPSWTTLIALLDEGAPLLGIVDAAALGERYVGTPDGAFLDKADRRLALNTSDRRTLCEARLSTTDPYIFDPSQKAAFERLRGRALTTRYGLDAYGYARVAAGSLDLVVEAGLKPHDYNALIPVVRGAGGVIGDWKGGEDFERGQIVAAASRELYEEAVRLIG